MNRIVPALAASFFLLAGLALIPWPGLQYDELFFSGPVYAPGDAFYGITVGGVHVPLMVISYTGALKTWIYQGLLQFFVPNVWLVRVPVLLMGVATIALTWLWVRRIADARAAAIAAVLLATDTTFLLTDVFDWGPVALQHLLLMAGLAAIQTGLAKDSKWWLAPGFFFFGLGMWDKALFAWPLAGMAVGAFCLFRRELFRRIRWAPIAAIAFLLGAAPLIWYNVARRGATATANAGFTTADLPTRIGAFRHAVDGSMLFVYIVNEYSDVSRRAPRGFLQRASVRVSKIFRRPAHNGMYAALLAAVLLSAIVPRERRRLLAFLAITAAVGWLLMIFNKGTGVSAHHLVLLWPFPIVFIAVVCSSLAERFPRAAIPVVVLLAASNLLVDNEYLARFIVNGGRGPWTDAIFRLNDAFEPPPRGWTGIVDWGYLNPLRLLHDGDLRLFQVDLDAAPAELARQVEMPGVTFIQHTDAQQIFPGINQRLREAARRLGYEEEILRAIPDEEGRPMFEIFRFRPFTNPARPL